MLHAAITQSLPSFVDMPDRVPGYWFHREPGEGEIFHRTVLIQHSAEWARFSVDVCAGILPVWDRQYGTFQLMRATSLPCLRLASASIPIEESFYSHSSSSEDVNAVLQRIANELRIYALPWFDQSEVLARHDVLVQRAFTWLKDNWAIIPADVGDRMREAFRRAYHPPYGVDLALLNDLKDALRRAGSEPLVSQWQRQQIAILAIHILGFAGYVKKSNAHADPPDLGASDSGH